MSIASRFKNAWNTFFNRDPTDYRQDVGVTFSFRPDRIRLTRGNERSIVTAIFNRMAVDAADIEIKHVQLDEEGQYLHDRNSTLNDCFNLEANKDQTGRAFRQDIYMSMFDEGCIAIVPIDTDIDPNSSESYKILTMRTAKILEWGADDIKVQAYNDRTGLREDIWFPKSEVAIVENPFFAVMNERNSTLQRLIRKLNLLDSIDEQSGSGKLDLIVQLPYTIKSDARRQQADKRRKDIEDQLQGNKLGIAYTDATEKITQLNRPVENNLMKQIEYLTSMLMSQLNITQGVLDGTADIKTMHNYNVRTIEVCVATVVDESKRKFLTKTARSQGQSMVYFRDPLKFVPPTELASMAESLTGTEIMTSNEFRPRLGLKPSRDPRANELRNKRLNAPENNGGNQISTVTEGENENQQIVEEENQNGEI